MSNRSLILLIISLFCLGFFVHIAKADAREMSTDQDSTQGIIVLKIGKKSDGVYYVFGCKEKKYSEDFWKFYAYQRQPRDSVLWKVSDNAYERLMKLDFLKSCRPYDDVHIKVIEVYEEIGELYDAEGNERPLTLVKLEIFLKNGEVISNFSILRGLGIADPQKQ